MTLLTERYGQALRTAITRDLATVGPEVWTRFVGRREGPLWYYRAVTEALEGRVGEEGRIVGMVSELGRVVGGMA